LKRLAKKAVASSASRIKGRSALRNPSRTAKGGARGSGGAATFTGSLCWYRAPGRPRGGGRRQGCKGRGNVPCARPVHSWGSSTGLAVGWGTFLPTGPLWCVDAYDGPRSQAYGGGGAVTLNFCEKAGVLWAKRRKQRWSDASAVDFYRGTFTANGSPSWSVPTASKQRGEIGNSRGRLAVRFGGAIGRPRSSDPRFRYFFFFFLF